MQDKHHKKMKKQEMKVFTMYEGWDAEKEKQNRSTLVEKQMLAGMEKSTEFHEKREASIRKILLVGINYDKQTKKHQCHIEEWQKE